MAATINDLKQERAGIIAKCKTLSDARKISDRPFTDDEKKVLAEGKASVEALDAKIAAIEADESTGDFFTKLATGLDESTGRRTQPDSLGKVRHDEQGRVTSFIEDAHDDVTLAFTNSPDASRRQSYKLSRKQDWRRLGEAGYKPAGRGGEFTSFSDFVREGFDSSRSLSFQNRVQKHYLAVQGMSEGVAADGGYLVMPEFAQGIIDRVYANDLWSRTDNFTVTGNNMTFNVNAETSRANGSRHGGLRGYWVGEGNAVTASKPTFREVSMKLYKLGVLVYLTSELLDDGGAALEQYVARKAAEEFNFMIGDSLINGTGAGQPLGILNAPSLVSVAKESGQAAATLQPENVVKMNSRFFAPNNGNSVWLQNQDIDPQLHLMTLGIGSSGIATYMPPGGLSSAPYATLMGRPLLPTEFNATLGTQGDLIKADLGQILSISKGGLMSAASIHVEFLTDQLVLRFVMRLNAQPWESSAITPYKGSNTQSNFVTLDTRA